MDTLRHSIHPAPGDTWATIAEAHLPGEDSGRLSASCKAGISIFLPAASLQSQTVVQPIRFSLATSYFLSRRSRSLD